MFEKVPYNIYSLVRTKFPKNLNYNINRRLLLTLEKFQNTIIPFQLSFSPSLSPLKFRIESKIEQEEEERKESWE